MNASSNEPLCNATLCFVKDYLAGEGQIEMSTIKPQKHSSKEMKVRAVWGGSEWNTQHRQGWQRPHGRSRSCSFSTFLEGKGKRKGCMYHEIPFCLKMNAVTTTLRQVTVSFCPGDLHFSLFQFFFLMSRNGPKIHVTN